MKLHLDKIKASPTRLAYHEDAAALNERLHEGHGGEDFRFPTGLDADLEHYRAGLDVVFEGPWEAVNRHFVERAWSDGLPIVPPTLDRVRAFLEFAERDPVEPLGVLLPDSRQATVWSVAVNGVMAGCRPEHFPVLLAIAEALADPGYGNEHSGDTTSAEMLVILMIVIIIFGANRLPQLGRGIGSAIKNFKEGIKDETTDKS